MKITKTTLMVWLVMQVVATVQVSAAQWKEQVLYSFQGGSSDGSDPAGGVVFDKGGNLYGATTGAGNQSCAPIGNECGLVYQLSPPVHKGDSWVETILYQFKGNASEDGSVPAGGVILDASGNIYGTTAYGGTGDCVLLGTKAGCGTVYELSPPAKKGDPWTEQLLYSFKSGKDGYFPWGALTFDAKGNLYGATQFGGGRGDSCNSYYQYCGTVFKLAPPKRKDGKWTETVLHSFAGVASGHQFGDGANPNGRLTMDSKGVIYGTTYYGGNNQQGKCRGGVGGTGCGTVFALSPPKTKGGVWTETLLDVFDGENGSNPPDGVIADPSGNLYCVTQNGPPHGYGLVLRLKKPGGGSHHWRELILHRFTGEGDGEYPSAGMILDSSGVLYGTALGGENNAGVFYRLIAKPRASFTILYALKGPPDGNHPAAALSVDHQDQIYGTTLWGGSGTCQGGCGTVIVVTRVQKPH